MKTKTQKILTPDYQKTVSTERKIFLNNMNSWLSNFIIEELRTDCISKNYSIKNNFTGTLNLRTSESLPRFFKPEVVEIDLNKELNNNILFNDIFIYDLNTENFKEAELLIRALRNKKYRKQKTLILISNVMTWAKSKEKKYSEEDIQLHPELIEEKVKISYDYSTLDTNYSVGYEHEGLKDIDNQISRKKKNKKELNEIESMWYFTDKDYNKRIPHYKYKKYKEIEDLALANNNPKLKVIVICPGFIYGCGEAFFYEFFRTFWLREREELLIPGEGNEFIPTIHIKDLVKVIKYVIEENPIRRYIIAVDNTEMPIMRKILGTLSITLGCKKVRCIPYKEINVETYNIPHYNEITSDIKIKQSDILKDIDWEYDKGFIKNIDNICKEFIIYRGLSKNSYFIYGPPSSGKTPLAKELSQKLLLRHVETGELINSTKESKSKLAIKINNKFKELEDLYNTELEAFENRKVKKKSDKPPNKAEIMRLPDELILQIFKEKLENCDCAIRGYILEGYPKTYEQAKELFSKDGKVDKNLLPNNVIFIKNEGFEYLSERVKNYHEKETIKKQIKLDEIKVRVENKKKTKKKKKKNTNEQIEDEESKINNDLDRLKRRFDSYQNQNQSDLTLKSFFEENQVHIYEYDSKDSNLPFDLFNDGTAINNQKLIDKKEMYHIRINNQKVKQNRTYEFDGDPEEIKRLQLSKEMQDYDNNVQNKINTMNNSEKSLLEKSSEIMRFYLNNHLYSIISKGILSIINKMPQDPVEVFAQYLEENNPMRFKPLNDSYYSDDENYFKNK